MAVARSEARTGWVEATSIGMFVGPPLGGMIADSMGLGAVFLAVAAVCVLAAAWGGATRALAAGE